MLGLSPGNREIFADFIADKAPATAKVDEEAAALPGPEEMLAKGTCVFAKDEGGLFFWDYQIRGYFKESMKVLVELGQIKEPNKWNVSKAIDSVVFVTPRKIYLRDGSGEIIADSKTYLERPLRASTLQGDRIALARSQQVSAGTKVNFTVSVLAGGGGKSWANVDLKKIQACLDYGQFKGLGHWRGSGYGRFKWEEQKKK
jgi:hypothetical protein